MSFAAERNFVSDMTRNLIESLLELRDHKRYPPLSKARGKKLEHVFATVEALKKPHPHPSLSPRG